MPEAEQMKTALSPETKNRIVREFLVPEKQDQLVQSMVPPILYWLQHSLPGVVTVRSQQLIVDTPAETLHQQPEAAKADWPRLREEPHKTLEALMGRLRTYLRKTLDLDLLRRVRERTEPEPGPIPEGWSRLVMNQDTLQRLPADARVDPVTGDGPTHRLYNDTPVTLSSHAEEGLVYAFGDREAVGDAYVGLELSHTSDDDTLVVHADLACQVVFVEGPAIKVYAV